MHKKLNFRNIVNICSAIVLIIFICFFVYMIIFENVSVYNLRETSSYYTVENIEETVITDSSAPAGIKKEYKWKMEDMYTNENCLAFYVVHQYVDVYFDDELIYSLNIEEDNKIGKTTSSNWIAVPIYPQDTLKEVRIVVTPVYESAIEFDISFVIGSYIYIFLGQLIQDLPQLILSIICILIGIIIIILNVIFAMLRKNSKFEMYYLGIFSIFLGIWRITDTRISPVLFSTNEMVLGYITIGMLFIGGIPLLLFMRGCMSDFKTFTLNILIIINCIVAMMAIVCQVIGIAEFREIIMLSHVTLIFSMAITIGVVVLKSIRKDTKKTYKSLYFALLLIFGGIVDIFTYYIKANSSGVFCTMIAFIIYELIVLVMSIRNMQKRAYIDVHTGLVNKNRWNELTKGKKPISDSVGIVMIDLNRLKYVNDTMGHDIGDKMIFNFANILRNSISPENIICRWGGDEFVILINDANHEKLQNCIDTIANAVKEHNESHDSLVIHYAVGYALSSDYDSITYNQLLKKADEKMYINKKQWYRDNLNITR